MQKDQSVQVLRAAAAVCRRIWISYIRYPSWTISLLIWPILFPFGHVFACRTLVGPDNAAVSTFANLSRTADYVGYVVIGTTIWQWFNTILWGLGSSLRSEQVRGTLESNWLAPVHKIFLGSQFPVTVLPRPLRAISLALPLTYAYDAIRGQLLNTQTLLPFATELLILVVCMFVFFALGYLIFRRIERRCRSLGTLSQH